MAKPTTYVGSNVAFFIEDSAAPGTFIRPRGLTSHTFSFSKNTQDVNVPDCDDYEAAAWVERGVESLDFSGNGSGILAAEAVEDWWAVFNSTASINGRLYIGANTDTTNGHYWDGKFHITGFEVNGERGGKANITVSMVSDGELTFNTVT